MLKTRNLKIEIAIKAIKAIFVNLVNIVLTEIGAILFILTKMGK